MSDPTPTIGAARVAAMLNAARLREAASTILLVRASLDLRKHECEACGLTKAENWPDAQRAKELRACADKLVRIATEMQGG